MDLIAERTIALAGVIQACQQVQSLARTGEFEEADAQASLNSILILDALNTPAVYGGIDGVRSGLIALKGGVLNSASSENVEVLRYVMSVLQLQSQLYRDQQKFTEFGLAIERLTSFPKEEILGAYSKVYQDFISTMRPQIIVQGEQDFLQRNEVPERIRSLLLAAFRSAVLWQQKDGSRFKILWQRTRMKNTASALLDELPVH